MAEDKTTDERKLIGKTGENIALCRYVDMGYKPVAINWRAGRMAEIDIAVLDPQTDTLCICEVKTRSVCEEGGNGAGPDFRPSDSVRARKIMKIKYAVRLFIEKNPGYSEKNVRFDVAEVYNNKGAYSVSIIENAF